jgi:hypothetical protein
MSDHILSLCLQARLSKLQGKVSELSEKEVRMHVALTTMAEEVAEARAAAETEYLRQRLTLVHISAQRKRFLWDRGALRDC